MGFVVAAVAAVVKAVVTIVKVVAPIIKAVLPVVAAVVGFVAGAFVGSIMNVGSFDVGGGGGTGGIGDIASESEAQQGVLLTKTGSNKYIPIVYGYRKVGGIITFAETGSSDNKYLWVAYVFSEGQIEGLREVFIDDYQLPSNIIEQLNVGNTVDISEGKYSGRVKLQFFHGTYHQDPTNSNVGRNSICKDAPSWKESMVYNGLAVMFARYEWKKIETQEDADNNPFGGSIPELQASILGKKIARLDIDNPSAYTYDAAPVRYSSNPAEHLLDYLRNPRYGKGLRNKDFDWDFWKTAAAKCNTVVQYVDSGTSGPILTSNMVVDTGKKLFANTRTLLSNFRGYMPYVQGKYRLKIEDAGNATDILSGVATIVNTFDEDNIVGTVTYTGIEKASKYNSVKVGFIDPDKKWSNAEVVYPETEAERQVYIDEDNGRVNQGEAFYPGITNYAIAKDMARLIFNKSRFQETCSLSVSSEGLELEPGDNVYIQSKLLNFSTTPWRVVSIDINPNMTVDLACVRNRDDIYPHTRVGEEDIVLPPYVPRGAQIYYPAVQTDVPVGLVPPTNARVPTIYEPPTISAIAPSTVASAGVNQITVYGNNFYNGVSAVFIGADGTEYTPNDTDRVSRGRVDIETVATMTDANQPYSVKITNAGAFGGLSATLPNCLNVDNTVPPRDEDPIDNPPIVDPPIIDDPDLNAPPQVDSVTPKTFGSPGVNTITVIGNYFRPGVDAEFLDGGGSSYAPNSVTRVSQRRLEIETTAFMSVTNDPYHLRIFNTSDYGGNDILLVNILNVDGTNPPAVTDPDENNVYVVPGRPPQVEYTYPGSFDSPGVNLVTVRGTHFYPGMNAVFIGNDGTVYNPTTTNYDSDTTFFLETTAAMTDANNPYQIRLTNSGTFGSGQTLVPNAFSVDAVAPPVEDPVIEDPGDGDYEPPDTPNPSDPPGEGESDNNQPDDPDEAYGNDDVIEITNIEYVTNNDQGVVYLRVTFVGSDNPMYEQVKFYWHRSGTNDPYYDYVVTTDPGPGNEYTFLIGDPLLPGQTYDIFSRIKYGTGEYSTKTGKVTITPTFGGSVDPVDFVEDSNTAWPTTPGEPNQRRDDIPVIDLITRTSSGAPLNPRQVIYSVTQPTDTREPNFEIEGLWIIYKPSTRSYWSKTDEYFYNDYVPGQPYDFAYSTGLGYRGPTLGAPEYPDIPTDAEQNYDFIFRFKYKDAGETKQIRYMNVPIEYQNGTYDFNAVGSIEPIVENISDFSINYDPPPPPTNVEDMAFNIAYLTTTTARGTPEMVFWMEPPDASYRQYWRGFEIQLTTSDRKYGGGSRYRETVTDITSGYTKVYVPYTPDQTMEIAVTTIIDKYQRSEYVANPSLTPVYDRGDYGYRGKGKIKSNLTGVGVPTTLAPDGSLDYATVMNFTQMDSVLAYPYSGAWVSLIRSDIDDVPAPSGVEYYSSSYNTTAGYYKLDYKTEHINRGYSIAPPDFKSLDEITIYRRSRAQTINQQQYAYNTYGVGRWEKFVIDMTSSNEKIHTSYMRPALTYRYYNPEYNPNDPDSSLTIPYYENMVEQIGTEDFIIQIKVDGTNSSRGLLLPRVPANVEKDAFIELQFYGSPKWVDLDDFNQLPTAYLKNLNQAITAPQSGLVDYLGNAYSRTDSHL